ASIVHRPLLSRIPTRCACRSLTVAAAILGAIAVARADQVHEASAAERFAGRLAVYLAVRHDAEVRVGLPRVSSSPDDIVAAQEALADAIRSSRPSARTGDVFSADIADAF